MDGSGSESDALSLCWMSASVPSPASPVLEEQELALAVDRVSMAVSEHIWGLCWFGRLWSINACVTAGGAPVRCLRALRALPRAYLALWSGCGPPWPCCGSWWCRLPVRACGPTRIQPGRRGSRSCAQRSVVRYLPCGHTGPPWPWTVRGPYVGPASDMPPWGRRTRALGQSLRADVGAWGLCARWAVINRSSRTEFHGHVSSRLPARMRGSSPVN